MSLDEKIELEVTRQNNVALQQELMRQQSRVDQWKGISWFLLLVLAVMLFAILQLNGCVSTSSAPIVDAGHPSL